MAMAGLLVFAVAASAPAITTEDVLAKLTKQRGEIKSFEYDMKMLSKTGPMKDGTMTSHVAMQVVEKDGKPAGHLMNMKSKMTRPDGVAQEVLMVNDGEFLWQEVKDPESGMVMVMKHKADTQKADAGDSKQFTDQYDLKYVGEEEFEGKKMWVLEGASKAKDEEGAGAAGGMGMGMGMMEQPAKARLSIGQKDSLLHRIILYNKEGKEMSEMQITNAKVNEKIDPALFKYTPPPGAKVMDMTKGMPDMGGMMGDE